MSADVVIHQVRHPHACRQHALINIDVNDTSTPALCPDVSRSLRKHWWTAVLVVHDDAAASGPPDAAA